MLLVLCTSESDILNSDGFIRLICHNFVHKALIHDTFPLSIPMPVSIRSIRRYAILESQ